MRVVFVSILMTLFLGSFAQVKSSFNQLEIEDSVENYHFIVSGHFYGSASNRTGYPANTLLAHLDWINEHKPSMLVCLGDLFKDIKNDIPNYEKSLFEPLQVPLINAVGNHDISDEVYQDHFGATYYKFRIGDDIHIVLDTELNNGDIEGDQLELLKAVEETVASENINNVFVYGHRTIWDQSYDELQGVFTNNTKSLMDGNYDDVVLPLVESISKHSDVYWFAGSLGSAPASFMHFDVPDKNITYIATAIRALPRDAFLLVDVENGSVNFEGYSLTGEDLKAIEEYDPDFWKNNSAEEPFNWRLLPLYIKQTILSWAFWWGFLSSLILVAILVFIKRRRMKV